MEVGVPGSGGVAQVLAGCFLKHGHDVLIGLAQGTRQTDGLGEGESKDPNRKLFRKRLWEPDA